MNPLTEIYKSIARKHIALLIAIIAVTAVIAVYSICVTQYSISFSEALEVIHNHRYHIVPEDYRGQLVDFIVWDGLIPRSISGVLIGAILGVCGCLMQSTIRNPLADPYTTGISSGALLGVTLSVIFGISIIPGLDSDLGMMSMAFIFALIPCTVILFISAFKKVSPTVIVLIGIALMYLFTSISTLFRYTGTDEDVSTIYSWTVGTLGKCHWDSTLPLIITFVAVFSISMYLSRSINVMSTNDQLAVSLGGNPQRIRLITMIIVSLAAAAAVCYSGTIGFVGLVAPHIARIFVGSNTRILIPASACLGAFILIAADAVARVIIATGLPVGVITSLVGGPVFLIILIRQKKSAWGQ